MPRSCAFYSAHIAAFMSASPAEVLGTLVSATDHHLDAEQKRAWVEEIDILRSALADLDGWLYLEFDVPRLGSRIDAVVISGPAIFPLEFKCGEREYRRAHVEQAWDYALDLKNFHQGSHHAPILPVLIATESDQSDHTWGPPHADDVRPPIRCNGRGLGRVLRQGLTLLAGAAPSIDGEAWGGSPYHPTPTIIEAARALYARHSVEAISRNDAGATNLRVTSAGVEEIIERSRAKREKAIVFVTGVPGAGKTLVGLNVATRRRELGDARAVFLSGNGPLVSVLQEALTRDEFVRTRGKERKGAIRQKVKPFIQNVHHFRDEGVRSPGIGLWLDTIRTSFPEWRVCISPSLTDSEYAAGHALDALGSDAPVDLDPRLHLASSMRSFRSEKVSAFVKAVLDCDVDGARGLLAAVATRYPIVVTRDLARAKHWVREHARGSERYGLVASSSAERLKPHAVDVRVKVDPVQWFLGDAEHTRSSFYLEDAATEFQVQGLELDWICVTWDADLRLRRPGCWEYKSFRGKQWQNVNDDQRRRYLLNAYRVLLTRARQGMVIFVPPGDESDPTRKPEFYDGTFNYLRELGLPVC